VSAHEWQQLAWKLAAHDIGTDVPDPRDGDAYEWFAWAEKDFGAQARAFIATSDALAEIRRQRN